VVVVQPIHQWLPNDIFDCFGEIFDLLSYTYSPQNEFMGQWLVFALVRKSFGFATWSTLMNLRTLLLLTAFVAVVVPSARAATIFSDDFESGNMNNWTTTGSNALVNDATQNVVPSAGSQSALMNTSADRMHHNLVADNGGSELSGYSTFTSYIYDASGTATRIFNEVRGYSGGTGLPDGGTTASGSLAQLLAIGKYNTVTLSGETYNGSKYQARVTFGSSAGWFNLDAAGSPNRSTGWHKFTVERLADDTTLNFYVDDILSRTITGATAQSWDTVVLGPGLGTTVGDAWIDGMSIDNGVAVPEPASFSLFGLAFAGALTFARRKNR
jgi:hypothetical protein